MKRIFFYNCVENREERRVGLAAWPPFQSDVCSLTLCHIVPISVKTEKREERRVKSAPGGRAAC